VIDEPALRMAIERVLNGIEHIHRFTRAVSVGNPREFLQAEKQEQEMAEACKRLIKNCIICWNYPTWKLAEGDEGLDFTSCYQQPSAASDNGDKSLATPSVANRSSPSWGFSERLDQGTLLPPRGLNLG
jgi:Tn3 transposase DDE domain